MSKSYYSLGLMSGTSMDGVDASVIQTDGRSKYMSILDKYFEYPKSIYKNLTTLRDKIKSPKDLKKHQKQIQFVEKEITIFHAESVKKILKKTKVNVDFIGFHGQTIFHNAEKKITKQLGNGRLLSKLTEKIVVCDFRQNDLKNGGQGAPLAPIFHKLLINKNKIPLPVMILNIGGIANLTSIDEKKEMDCSDLGPGNCMIDQWIRFNYKNKIKYDKDGKIAKSGRVNLKVFKKIVKRYKKFFISNKRKISFDVKDFDISLVKDLSLKDGAATLTEYSGDVISSYINNFISLKIEQGQKYENCKILVCGGGVKNKTLMKIIDRNFIYLENEPILSRIEILNFKQDIGNIDGDFVESQAFAYLAVRSYLKLPISFPETTGCKKPCTGGVLVKSF